jgi:transcriptional regulator with XRE-family HTH domain
MIENQIDKILKSASKKIRAERIALELSQEEFADFVNIKLSTYKTFEQKGKITFENYVRILIKINKIEQFKYFLDGFEFNEQKERAYKKNDGNNIYIKPIIDVSQKEIILDKKVFGPELFYSVEDGHKFEVPNFINIILNSWDERRLMLLFKYFGQDRLKPYILERKDINLLKSFNKHLVYVAKQLNPTHIIPMIKPNVIINQKKD